MWGWVSSSLLRCDRYRSIGEEARSFGMCRLHGLRRDLHNPRSTAPPQSHNCSCQSSFSLRCRHPTQHTLQHSLTTRGWLDGGYGLALPPSSGESTASNCQSPVVSQSLVVSSSSQSSRLPRSEVGQLPRESPVQRILKAAQRDSLTLTSNSHRRCTVKRRRSARASHRNSCHT